MKQKTYEVMVHLWWEKLIRKVTIFSKNARVEMWFKKFGHVTIDERETRDVFSGIVQALMGTTEGEAPEIYASIDKGEGAYERELVRDKEELLAFIQEELRSLK